MPKPADTSRWNTRGLTRKVSTPIGASWWTPYAAPTELHRRGFAIAAHKRQAERSQQATTHYANADGKADK